MKTKKRSWEQFQKDEFRKDILPYVRCLIKSIRDNPQKYSTPEKVNELQMIIEFCQKRDINLFDYNNSNKEKKTRDTSATGKASIPVRTANGGAVAGFLDHYYKKNSLLTKLNI